MVTGFPRRHGNTGREMVDSGQWAKVGKKHYRHVSGNEAKWDCNVWGWRINDGKSVYDALWVVRGNVEAGVLDDDEQQKPHPFRVLAEPTAESLAFEAMFDE